MKNKNKAQSPLFRLRKSLDNISLQEMANELEVSYAMLVNVENGIYKILPEKFLENLKAAGYPWIDVFEQEYYKFIDNKKQLKDSINWKELESL